MRRTVAAMVFACMCTGSALAVPSGDHADLLSHAIEQAVMKRLPSWEGSISFACANERIVNAPTGTQKVDVRSVRFEPSGRGIATVYIGVDKGAPAVVTVTFCLTGTIAAFVAARNFNAGEWVNRESVAAQRVSVDRTDLSGKVLVSVDGLRALRAIKVDETVSSANTQIGREVERGEKVRVQLNDGKIAIETEAVALRAASVGQQTFIRPAHSSTALPAMVTAPGQVQIESAQK